MASDVLAAPARRLRGIKPLAALRWVRRRILVLFSAFIIFWLIVAGFFAPLLAPHDPRKGDLDDRNTPPMWMGAHIDVKDVVGGAFEDDPLTEINLNRASNLQKANKIMAVLPVGERLVVEKVVVEGARDDKPKDLINQITLGRAQEIQRTDQLLVDGQVFTGEIALDMQVAEVILDGDVHTGQISTGDVVGEVIRRPGAGTFVLGTDQQGRDLLSRIIWGARVSLVVTVVTLGIAGVIGTLIGLLSGYYGGWVDEILMRLVDIVLALPLVLVAIVAVVAIGRIEIPFLPQKEVHLIAILLSLFLWVRFARQTRGEVLQLKTLDYVALARVSGCSTFRIIFIHLLPGVMNTLIVVATLNVSVVILLESTLSFLGAGVPPPTPAWGSMVAEGRNYLRTAWWVSTMPGFALLLVVMAMNLMGDWIRDALDPRLRQLE